MEDLNELAQWVTLAVLGGVLLGYEMRLTRIMTMMIDFMQAFLTEEENQK